MSKKEKLPPQITNQPANTLMGIIIIAIMVLGMWQAVLAWRNSAAPDMTWHPFRTGVTTKSISDSLDANLPAKDGLVHIANGVRYRLLHGGGEQVTVGENGWLFLTEELRHDADYDQQFNLHLQRIVEIRNTLQARGTQLVIALIPDKARIYGKNLPGGHYPDYQASRYADAIARLETNGISVVNVAPVLEEAAATDPATLLFHRTDTHWTQAGAKMVARQIAASANLANACSQPTTFATQYERTSERTSDLIRMMGLEGAPRVFRPAYESESKAVTSQSGAGSTNALSLLGDTHIDVVLTGTSFSKRGNFHGALQEAMRCEVVSIAKDGAAFSDAIGNFLNDPEISAQPVRVLIWELPERFLTLSQNSQVE